jgi:hypothetical protein
MMMLVSQVRVGRRFQRSIRVDTDIDQPAALEGFVCPPSAAQALVSMARQVAETNQGAFTWTGPYGSGKSSLAVALAALLGPDNANRKIARTAIGQEPSAELLALLKAGRKGWATLPIVASRTDPASAIADALDGPQRGRKRAIPTGNEVIEKLRLAASETPGAGLIVVIDEMGKFLEHVALGDGDVFFFQQLAETASRSNGRLVVIGILHQAFDDYAHRLAREVRDEWLKIQGRFADIPINVAGEEQIALIARAIETDAPREVGPPAVGIANAVRRNRPGTASHLDQELAACWPLHPIVACLLGPLSRRRFGQNQRSVFGFLNSAEPHGFQEFLRTTAVDGDPLYPPALLWDYLRANLESSILASPDGHRWSLAVEAVERCEARGGDLIHLEVVKTIALIDLFKERSGLLPSEDVLAHALLSLSTSELKAMLDQLAAWSIIIFKKFLGAFTIYAGSDFDIDAAVDQAYSRMNGIDFTRLRDLAMLQPILAKRHYHTTGALRWFDIDIAPLIDGTDRVKQYRPQNGATGLFLLLIATEAETGAKARKLWHQAADTAGDVPVAVGWSRDGYTIRELARELLALESVRAERAELNGDAVARREVNARIAHASADLEERLRQAFQSAEWKAKFGLADNAAPPSLQSAGFAGLNAVASTLADLRYPQSPRLQNELLNRIKPSSNAIAAQKALLKAMVEGIGQDRLGIVGYPAHGGLYASLLEQTGLYRTNESGSHRFADPASDNEAGLAHLWHAADVFFLAAGTSGGNLRSLFEVWQTPPYGLRNGLFPVFAIAYVLSRADRLSIYLDETFQPRLTSLLTDRLTQDPGCIRVRWSTVSDFHRRVLAGVAEAIATHGGFPGAEPLGEPLAIAQGLVGVVTGLKGWTLKTQRLSANAVKVRNLASLANDPNKFLLDDIPSVFGTSALLTTSGCDGGADQASDATPIIAAVQSGLDELIHAYPLMLRELAATMLTELRIPDSSEADLAELHIRAATVRELTGNYRLDAFATRLTTYTGQDDEIEGITSLATNKPPRDWVDRDIDQARVEIAALAQEFVKAEGLAHVKGRRDRRHTMALYFGDPSRPSPVTPEFNIAIDQQPEVDRLTAALRSVVNKNHASRDVALAALAELGSQLAEAETIVTKLDPARPLRQQRA